MASPHGQPEHSIAADILSQPWEYDFFHALRTVENEFPSKPRIGRSRSLREDALRFGQFLSLSFAASTLEKPQERQAPANKLAVRFTGLTGPHGPLPLRMTEFIRNRLYGAQETGLRGQPAAAPQSESGIRKDSTLAAFLDIFHHRSISLFYRAWAVAQKTADFDREDDRGFSRWLASFFGCGEDAFDGVDAVPTWRKLPYTGFLADQHRHGSGLAALLRTFFNAPVSVQELAGHWLKIPPEQWCRLGASPATASLGTSAIVGSRIWDRQLKISIRLGPVSFQRFQTFLPGGEGYRELHDWLAFYTRREFSWEAVIILRKEEVPGGRLGTAGALGRTAWLLSGRPPADAPDFKLRGGGLNPGDNN
jgi:type VI secretion system protein ImpH